MLIFFIFLLNSLFYSCLCDVESSESRKNVSNAPVLPIRKLPGVKDFRSDVYEVRTRPYGFKLPTVSAIAIVSGKNEIDGSPIEGTLEFSQRPSGPVYIRGNITGLPRGTLGLRIHQSGDVRNECQKIGQQFNPYKLDNGGPERKAGDLGNIESDENETTVINIKDGTITLTGFFRGIVGRAVAVTADTDDSEEGSTDKKSGKILACGVIAHIS